MVTRVVSFEGSRVFCRVRSLLYVGRWVFDWFLLFFFAEMGWLIVWLDS